MYLRTLSAAVAVSPAMPPPDMYAPLPCTPLMPRMPPSPVNRITDRCKNITFPQLLLRTVINETKCHCAISWTPVISLHYIHWFLIPSFPKDIILVVHTGSHLLRVWLQRVSVIKSTFLWIKLFVVSGAQCTYSQNFFKISGFAIGELPGALVS